MHLTYELEVFKLQIWQPLSKHIAIPVDSDLTTFPSQSIRLWAPVSSFIFPLGRVKFNLNRVPSEIISVVLIKAPAADISLVRSSNISFLFETIVSILAGRLIENLSNCRLSFMGRTFLDFKVQRFRGSEVRGPVKFAPLVFYEEFNGLKLRVARYELRVQSSVELRA